MLQSSIGRLRSDDRHPSCAEEQFAGTEQEGYRKAGRQAGRQEDDVTRIKLTWQNRLILFVKVAGGQTDSVNDVGSQTAFETDQNKG